MSEVKVNRLMAECIQCLIRGHIDHYPENCSAQEKVTYIQKLLKVMAEAPSTVSAPVLAREIYKIQNEMFGNEIDYTEIKKHFNQVMMEKAISIEKELEATEEPLKLGIQYAMMGNYIDFGALGNVDEDKLGEFLKEAKYITVKEEEYRALKYDLAGAKNMVYLTDNCGEIVMDKLLLQVIQKLYPEIQITIIVRGMPVVNDATMEDAEQIGLTEQFRVIGNGSDIAGTCLDEVTEEAVEMIEKADVIFAKGQGNFETLQQCGKNIYYIFMCKCEMFANRFQVPRFSGMLLNDKNCM